jgi:hypothetical protein
MRKTALALTLLFGASCTGAATEREERPTPVEPAVSTPSPAPPGQVPDPTGQPAPSAAAAPTVPATLPPAESVVTAPASRPSVATVTTAAPSVPSPTATLDPATAVLIAAGDIASCDSAGDEATALLLDTLPGTIATLGDNAYDNGTTEDFRCYDASWGRHRARTRPSPGNHDYTSETAAGYFAYFADKAGDPRGGWYSYDLGAWHIVVLNSNCWAIGGCEATSAQGRWLTEDLRRSTARCTLAYWHHPVFSSGRHGSDPSMAPLWPVLHQYGVDVVLNGHDHHYERFAPQDPTGRHDRLRGIREFIVGTGGRSLYVVRSPLPNSEAIAQTFGVLSMTLRSESYDWRFIAVGGKTVDSGTGPCH